MTRGLGHDNSTGRIDTSNYVVPEVGGQDTLARSII